MTVSANLSQDFSSLTVTNNTVESVTLQSLVAVNTGGSVSIDGSSYSCSTFSARGEKCQINRTLQKGQSVQLYVNSRNARMNDPLSVVVVGDIYGYQIVPQYGAGLATPLPVNTTPGQLALQTSNGTPPLRTVYGGDKNVTVGMVEFLASGEDVFLEQLGLVLTSGSSSDVERITLWDGNVQIGDTVITNGQTRRYATLWSKTPVLRYTSKVLAIKADLAPIGSNSSGHEGAVIKIDVVGSTSFGTGQSSGSRIIASGNSYVNGVKMTALPTTTTTSVSKPLVCGSIGDVNGDGVISDLDKSYITSYTLGATFTDTQKNNADTSADNQVTSADNAYITNYLNGSISTFPKCTQAQTVVTPPTVDLKIEGSNGPLTVASGAYITPSFDSTNASSCTTNWNNDRAVNNYGITVGPLSSNQTYTVTCYNSGGQSASDAVVVNVTQAQTVVTPPTVDLKVEGSNGPLTVASGAYVTPSFTSTNASYCSASWNSDRAVNNYGITVGPISSSQTYAVVCYSSTGSSAYDSVVVNVTQPQASTPATETVAAVPAPTVDLKVDGSNGPLTLRYNAYATGDWTSTNATTCTNNFNAPSATSNGGYTYGPLTVNKAFRVTCYNSAGVTAEDYVTVNVEDAPVAGTNSLSASLLSTTDDRAGMWGQWGPGVGNGNKNPADWNWTATLSLASAKTVSGITMTHSNGEQWSTNGSADYPLVIFEGGTQLTPTLGTQFNLASGAHTLSIYGQKESTVFMGATLRVNFTDGSSLSTTVASAPTSRKAIELQLASVLDSVKALLKEIGNQ